MTTVGCMSPLPSALRPIKALSARWCSDAIKQVPFTLTGLRDYPEPELWLESFTSHALNFETGGLGRLQGRFAYRLERGRLSVGDRDRPAQTQDPPALF